MSKAEKRSPALTSKAAPRPTGVMPPWPHYAADERAAVDRVLASGKVNYWTGTEGREFEREYAAHLGVKRAIALMNGTVALELALRMWDIGPGDDVVVTPRSFIASASCAILLGARPVFADVDRDSGNLTAETIERALTPTTRAIIPVHLGGWPCDLAPVMEIARARGIRVLEDCAQANGARIDGRIAGSLGDAAAFSFCQDKIITTGGEGGLLATDDESLWERAWSFKDHGKTWGAVYERAHAQGFRWVHERFGTNWRLTEAQAAIGRIQLGKLEGWLEARGRLAAVYRERLSAMPALRIPEVPANVLHSFYRFYAYLVPASLKPGWTRDRIVAAVAESGARVFSGSCSEIYRERAFENLNWAPGDSLPVARELGETSLAFLVHPTMRDEHAHAACDAIEAVIRQATR